MRWTEQWHLPSATLIDVRPDPCLSRPWGSKDGLPPFSLESREGTLQQFEARYRESVVGQQAVTNGN